MSVSHSARQTIKAEALSQLGAALYAFGTSPSAPSHARANALTEATAVIEEALVLSPGYSKAMFNLSRIKVAP